VIEREGQLICITPSAIIEKEFPFIPDSKISWIEDGDVYSAIRDGRKIELGVRVFPEFTMAQCAILRERLLSGIDPRKAANFSNEEMEELKRRYIPRLGVRRVD
jgi:hypothetical protein